MALHFMYPDGVDLNESSAYVATGAATVPECLDDPVGTPNDDTDYARVNTSTGAKNLRLNLDPMVSTNGINSVTLRVRGRDEGSNGIAFTPYVRIGGVNYNGTAHTLLITYQTFEDNWATNPATGEEWTKDDLDSLIIGWSTAANASNEMRYTQALLVVDHVSVPAVIGMVRDVASRELLRFNRVTQEAVISGPLRLADVELGQQFVISHRAWPRPGDEGAGIERWEREPLIVIGVDENLDTHTVSLRCLEMRRYYRSLWDVGISEQPPSASGQGMARLTAGGARTWTRDSKAWIENAAAAAAGSKQVEEITEDVDKFTTHGTLVEGSRTNVQKNSSFKAVTSGWTTAGTGSNGSSIAADTTETLFAEGISDKSIKFTAADPSTTAGALSLTGTATSSIASNTVVCASFDHLDDSASEPLYYAIKRGADTGYWRDSDLTWQTTSGVIWNAMDGSTDHHRHISQPIDIGTSATALTSIVGITTSGAAGQVNHLYHVQIEAGKYPTSRIRTDSTAVTRAADTLSYGSNHGARAYDPRHGTVYVEFIPSWNTSDLTTGQVKTLWDLFESSQHHYRLNYAEGTSAFRFRHQIESIAYEAVSQVSVVRGETYRIACRAVGEDGELDLSPYTLSVFVNGTKGTDAVAIAPPVLPSTMSFSLGHTGAGTNHADGAFSHLNITPVVLTDEEIEDLP